MKVPLNSTRMVLQLLSSSRSVRNVIWNMLGGAWAGVLIVFVTPWYVSRLGLEGYGILGLWLMMQVLMGLLDAGMGATVIREFANIGGAGTSREANRDLLRTLEIVYWAVAALLATLLFASATWFGEHWLKVEALPGASVGSALRMMSIALGLQFPCALYSSGLAGLQQHGRMNLLQIGGNALRHGGGVVVLAWDTNLVCFFAVQAIVAGLQTLATRGMLWRAISIAAVRSPAFSLRLLQRVWRFSVGMGLTAIIAVILSNVDRIALSKLVTAAELGRYTIAFTATGLLQMGIQPFYRAFFPRYAELVSSEDRQRLRHEYFQSCRFLAAVIIPAGIVGGVFAPEIFACWLGTNDKTVVYIFRYLLFGIACSGLMWLPAAYQQAHGWTRLHVAMMAGAVVLGLPLMLWAIAAYGPVGATAVWLVHGVSDITLGLWFMHRRLLVGELMLWYLSVVVPPLLVSIVLVGLSAWLMPHGVNKWIGFCWIGVSGLLTIGVAFSLSIKDLYLTSVAGRADARGE